MDNEIIIDESVDPLTARFIEEIESGRRLTSEDFRAKMISEYEAAKPERDAVAAKKKTAADELISLGVSKESAYLLANYYEEDLAKEEARIKAEYEDSKKDK